MEHDEYPEQRMKHLLTITSNAFVQSVQKQLSNIELWFDSKESIKTRAHLRNSANICERWLLAVEQLTTTYWRNYSPHPWKGEPFKATYLIQFKKRLHQIISIRSSYEQSLRFNSSIKKENLSANRVFAPFFNLNPIQFNFYTDPQWNSAMSEYENIMSSIDHDLTKQLREYFQQLRSNPQQMLVDFKHYSDLIQRDRIRNGLSSEREFILNHLEDDLKVLLNDFNNLTNKKNVTNSVIVNTFDISKQIEARVKENFFKKSFFFMVLFVKVNSIINDGEKLFNDLVGYKNVALIAQQLKQDLINWRKDKFQEWCQDTIRTIDDPSQTLKLHFHLTTISHLLSLF